TGVSAIIVRTPFTWPCRHPPRGCVSFLAVGTFLNVDQHRASHPAGAIPRALEARDQRRLAFDTVVVRAAHAAFHALRFATQATCLQIVQAGDQLLLQALLATNVLARLLELGAEERAQLFHGFRATVGSPPALERLAGILK